MGVPRQAGASQGRAHLLLLLLLLLLLILLILPEVDGLEPRRDEELALRSGFRFSTRGKKGRRWRRRRTRTARLRQPSGEGCGSNSSGDESSSAQETERRRCSRSEAQGRKEIGQGERLTSKSLMPDPARILPVSKTAGSTITGWLAGRQEAGRRTCRERGKKRVSERILGEPPTASPLP